MDTIICLVGASGSGKTTIAKELDKLDYNIIHSYTTRKPRKPNEWGHIFMKLGEEWGNVIVDGKLVGFENFYPIEHEKYQNIDIDDMIAFKEIYGEYYFATKEQYQGKGTSIYIVDPDGAEQIQKNVKDAKVITIFMSTYWEVCRRRMFKDTVRATKQVINRVEVDKELFSRVKCNYVVDANRELEEVLSDVVSIIENIGDIDE